MNTPGKDNSQQNLHGSIYERFDDGTYFYHCHAAISKEAKLDNPVWTIWREDQATGLLTCPAVDLGNGLEPQPDGNVATDPALLTYWSTL